jgi:DNA helicase-4
MSSLGNGGPPERVPSTPGQVDLTHEEIDQATQQEIGRGTNSIVYATALERRSQSVRLAVKKPDFDGTLDGTQYERIADEATTWEQLTDGDSDSDEIGRQDHIVSVVDHGVEPLPWLAMEYMDGGSLRDVLDDGDGRLPIDQALWVGTAVCEGVLHAHRRGVAHHDLKPSNVLFRTPARGWLFPKVGDWGLAKTMLDGDTQQGLTPAYAAPEQFHPDQFGQPDLETDIYQIGVLVYELVTGELPFDGPSPEIREAKLSEVPTPPSAVADVPEALDDALLPALEPETSARYEDIVYLRDSLDALFEQYHDGATNTGSTPPGLGDTTTSGAVGTSDATGVQADETEGGPTTEEPSEGTAEESGDDGTATETGDGETGPLATAGDSDTDKPAMQSWDEYREELEQRRQRFLYSVLPESLRRLFYAELTAELDRAERRREETESEIDETKTEARRLHQQLEDELYDAGVFGEQLSQETVERVWDVEDTRARLDTLLDEQQVYLTTDEQETATRLRDQLADHERYLNAKRKLDKAVESISSELDDIETRIDEALPNASLLNAETKRDLVADLDAVSQLVRSAQLRLDMDALTAQDREQFDRIVERERSLRERVEQHNPDLVQGRYSDRIDAATALREQMTATLEAYRRDGTAFPESPTECLETVTARLDALDAFLGSRQPEFLSQDQHDRLKRLREELAADRILLEAKVAAETQLPEIQSAVDDIRATADETLDWTAYLSATEREQFDDQITDIRGRLDALEAHDGFDTLTETDQTRVTDCQSRVNALDAEIKSYNPTLVRQRYERHDEAATRLLAQIRDDLADCRTEGSPLPEPADAYTIRLDQATRALSAFLDRPQATHLSDEQYERIGTLQSALGAERTYVETKAAFDARLEEIQSATADCRTAVDDALDTETYLTTPDRTALEERLEHIRAQLAAVADDGLLDGVSDADAKRLEAHHHELCDIESHIETYNERFVEQECETLDNLGPSDQSLNQRQRRAVVRDELHNRVIAGPGTGKTFSLLCRIAYLVRQGVPPSEILALSFNKHISGELEDRLDEQFDISGVDIRTLHSYGMKLVNQAYPSETLLVGQTRLREVGSILRELRETDSETATQYRAFRDLFESEHVSADYQARKEFYTARTFKKGKTLRGEGLEPGDTESKTAHRTIADTLFEYEIDYRYKKYAPWADPNDGDPYIPDFTLPQHGICIDYIPTERVQAERERYNRKRSAKTLRQFYEGTERVLLTLHGADIDSSNVDNHLKFKLEEAGVSLGDSLDKRAKINEMYEHNLLWRDIEQRIAEFVKKAKTNQIEPSAHLDELDEKENPLLYHFSHVATAVLEEYRRRYDKYDAYDYADMVSRATEILERGHADESMAYQHVLVDEFQDLNLGQVELLRGVLDHSDDAHLFAVGDDWQSIYGFRGARPAFFVNFEERFAPATTTELELNYRCPPSVVAASNALMAESDIETDKSLKSALRTDTTPTVHVVPGDDYCYETNAVTRATELVLESIREENRQPGEILVLARNEEGSPFVPRITSELQERDVPTDGYNSVTVTTAHGAKGSEAEHVIVVNAVKERDDGFPPVEQAESLTRLVDANEESHIAEERRLFYMALTRAKDRLDIQTRANWESPFLDPLAEYVQYEHVPVDCTADRLSVTGTVDRPREFSTVKQVGTLEIDGYEMGYMIPGSATDVSPLQAGQAYRIENAKVGAYDGHPQLQLDEDAEIDAL